MNSQKFLDLFFFGRSDYCIHYLLTLSLTLAGAVYFDVLVVALIAYVLVSMKELIDETADIMDVLYNLLGAVSGILIYIPLLI